MSNAVDESTGGWSELEARIGSRSQKLTPSERSISAYLLDNRATVPFETGARLAEAIGVSEMTVIRFVRMLGYANLRELKDRLRPSSDDAEALDDVRERFTSPAGDIGHLTESLQLELRAVQRAYEAATTSLWAEIVALLAKQRFVHVAGFQATKGVALDFASRLKYVRSGVRFAEATAGIYSEVLESDPATTVLVIIDTASYARKGVLLAKKARELGIPLVVVTDRFSHWAREYTAFVLEMNTHVGTFWDSTASLSVAANLLTHSIAVRMGDQAVERFEKMKELGDHFSEFDTAASRFGGMARAKPLKNQ